MVYANWLNLTYWPKNRKTLIAKKRTDSITGIPVSLKKAKIVRIIMVLVALNKSKYTFE